MTVVLVRYSKVVNDAFVKLMSKQTERLTIHWFDLNRFGNRLDVLDFATVSFAFNMLSFRFDAVVVGDVFWQTGQNICRWCQENNVRSYFLQHGQWVYTKNKMNPEYTPHATMFFGEDVAQMCSEWGYAENCRLSVTGSPRYDNAVPNVNGDYVYFCPPVVLEMSPSVAPKQHAGAMEAIRQLHGLDNMVNLMIHPHYREGDISFLQSTFPNAKFRDPAEDPMPLVSHSSKVLTHRNSTSVLDAIAHGKISVLMNFSYWDDSFFEREYFQDFALESDNASECINLLQSPETLDLDDHEEKAAPYIYLGDASSRIVQEFLF